ncbi:hypothetical protein J6590_093294, partial [Homalodisca vitripennis]
DVSNVSYKLERSLVRDSHTRTYASNSAAECFKYSEAENTSNLGVDVLNCTVRARVLSRSCRYQVQL